jgi:uncharacterized protein YkwD
MRGRHRTRPDATPSRAPSKRRLKVAAFAAILAVVSLASTAAPVFAWGLGAYSPSDESLLFSLTNQDRASAGLNALVNDSYLHKEAEWRAKDMGDNNYFNHAIPPSGNKVFYYMQKDGYCFNVAGENIGLSTWGEDVATSRIEVAFMGSPTHRANILGTWVRMGVGAYQAADGRKLYAVLFSIPCGAKAPAKPTPKRTAKPTPKPTTRPVSPPVSVNPTPLPTAQPTSQATAIATPLVSDSPVPSDTAGPTDGSPASTDPGLAMTPATVDAAGSLRVREKASSQGPVDSLFHTLFGGLFGW